MTPSAYITTPNNSVGVFVAGKQKARKRIGGILVAHGKSARRYREWRIPLDSASLMETYPPPNAIHIKYDPLVYTVKSSFYRLDV